MTLWMKPGQQEHRNEYDHCRRQKKVDRPRCNNGSAFGHDLPPLRLGVIEPDEQRAGDRHALAHAADNIPRAVETERRASIQRQLRLISHTAMRILHLLVSGV
jgi:hypothetical protein